MYLLKNTLHFYIFGNIHVALAGFCFAKITLLEFGIFNNITPIFVAFSIIVSYNFIRYYKIKTNKPNWLTEWFLVYKKWVLALCVLVVFLGVYIVFFKVFKLHSVIILFPFIFMALFYVVPLFKIGKLEISFRNFPSIKIFSIAITWAGVTVLFPLYEFGYEFSRDVYIVFVQRILILIAISIPFDIRDVEIDSKLLKTLPQTLGINNSKKVGIGLLFVFVLLEFFKSYYLNNNLYILLLVSFITGLFLWFSSSKKKRYYTYFWVESIPIIWFVLEILSKPII